MPSGDTRKAKPGSSVSLTSCPLPARTASPLFATAAAFQLFQSGISTFPDEDNWTCVNVLEKIAL